jgi:hypothetical protein
VNVDSELVNLDRRVDSLENQVLLLTGQVADLERHYAELSNELSLIASLQRSVLDLEARLKRMEDSDNTLNHQAAESVIDLQKRVQRLEQRLEPPDNLQGALRAVFPSVDTLVHEIETLFDCKDGDHRSEHTDPEGVSHPYHALALIAPADLRYGQQKLRFALYEAFVKLRASCRSSRPKLYWRYAMAQRIQEEYDAALSGAGARHKIRTRVAIPEADFCLVGALSPPDGALIATLKR